MSERIYLTTPWGEVAIVKRKIVAVCSVNIAGDNSTTVLSQVYVDGDRDPFNVLEDFEYVSNKI